MSVFWHQQQNKKSLKQKNKNLCHQKLTDAPSEVPNISRNEIELGTGERALQAPNYQRRAVRGEWSLKQQHFPR